MISITQSIRALEDAEKRNKAVARAGASVAGAVERAIKLLGAAQGQGPLQLDLSLRGHLEQGASPEALEKSSEQFEKAVDEFMGDLAQSIETKEREFKAMIKLLAEAAAAFSENANTDGQKLQRLTAEIESASRLTSIIELRKQLSRSIGELADVAKRMEHEGRARARKLERELDSISQKLASAESTAETDPLTGLGNRRKMEREASNAIAGARPFSLILYDLNGFKPVNDTYGHQQGDQLLRAVGKGLRNAVKRDDVTSRWGGDEFAILAFDCAEHEAEKLAQRISAATFGEFLIEYNGRSVSVTVGASFGVAAHIPGETASALFERADQRLYAQKSERRQATPARGTLVRTGAR